MNINLSSFSGHKSEKGKKGGKDHHKVNKNTKPEDLKWEREREKIKLIPYYYYYYRNGDTRKRIPHINVCYNGHVRYKWTTNIRKQ